MSSIAQAEAGANLSHAGSRSSQPQPHHRAARRSSQADALLARLPVLSVCGRAPSPAGFSGCRSCATRSTSSAREKQQQRTFEVAPRRGVLYDRNLRELAMTVQVDSIYAVPTEIDDKQAAARTLAAHRPHRS